jgi:4a-hydroxytetrahydrobiopterin dehydratase
MPVSTEEPLPLVQRKCVPCEGKVSALQGEDLDRLTAGLDKSWIPVDGHHLERSYTFKNFRRALNFTNRVGDLAETEGHHPEICTSWGNVAIKLWTHAAGGLTENDFILAAKISELAGR